MHHLDLLMTLTGALAAALVLGYVTNRLGLSPIVGYLLAGIAVGPHTPGFVADAQMAEQLAEIGVILLMFGVGLHFHPEELLRVRRVALPGAIGQSLVATAMGAGVARAFGWDWTSGIIFGLAISVASTVVLLRVLSDRGDLHTPAGHIAVGWLVVEDLFTVLVLVLMPAIFGVREAHAMGLPAALGVATFKIAALIALTFLVGGRVVPWILEKVAHTRSRELFTLAVLVLALGIAVGAAKLFSVSAALGAFLAGMIVGRSDFSLRAASDALPMRDAFAVLFFVSVGMLFDPQTLTKTPGLVVATIAVILVGKPLAALGIVLSLKYPLKVAFTVSVALAQIGEFSFILATRAREMGILTEEATNSLVAASIFSITINPLLYRISEPIDAWVMREPRLRAWLNARVSAGLPTNGAGGASQTPTPSHRAIVVGYGPVGQTVTRLLRESEIEPTVIELNLETVRRLREQGVNAVYGDASLSATLASAGAANAGTLILSASGVRHCEEVIRLARELNSGIRVLARSDYVREIGPLREAGAARVFSGEGEVALALIEEILRSLGATGEQIDRERDRFRREALG
jgi:CPA2 family monovalent cation:H+ antiporter-2